MSLPARWNIPALDTDGPALLGAGLNLSLPAARVLWARGYRDPDSARRFLQPRLDHLYDPFLLKDMDRAVERLRGAIARGEKVLLYGDYDVDGTSSIVILMKALQMAGASVSFHVPHRLRDGYGMRTDVIDRAAEQEVKLVISVDTGIRAAAVVAHARGLGIDVIVTDHHLPEAELPPALAVLNPNRHDCSYPEKNLCGAGVAFKLVQALLQRMDWSAERVSRITESFLKLVALATVADVVPLTGENRVIVRLGLDGFHTIRNHGLRALLRVAGVKDGDCPSATEVAFQIAPRINAAGRMASAEDVIELFLTESEARAAELAAQLHELNRDRRETEQAIAKAIYEYCVETPVSDADGVLVFSGKGWHKGVVGIVASRLVERFCRPAFVLCEDELTGLAQGSGRSISAFHLLDGLEAMPELFEKFGGHKQAAGLTMRIEKVREFRERLNRYALERLTPDDFRPTIELDGQIKLSELNDRSVSEVLSLAPFGFGNPAPLFGVMNAECAGTPGVFGDKHLKVPLRQDGRTVIAKAWNFAERCGDFATGKRLDFALCMQQDYYTGGWAVTVKDVRPSEMASAAG